MEKLMGIRTIGMFHCKTIETWNDVEYIHIVKAFHRMMEKPKCIQIPATFHRNTIVWWAADGSA